MVKKMMLAAFVAVGLAACGGESAPPVDNQEAVTLESKADDAQKSEKPKSCRRDCVRGSCGRGEYKFCVSGGFSGPRGNASGCSAWGVCED